MFVSVPFGDIGSSNEEQDLWAREVLVSVPFGDIGSSNTGGITANLQSGFPSPSGISVLLIIYKNRFC
ncbi:hypothetical protein HMPREF1986_02189 [Oribacterium sp. oral taxon 078 str. F0263]|nr:hypothetical protein HMPREF1986_02189 [Oribacterium sp. oral taxon 078 str. F0263]